VACFAFLRIYQCKENTDMLRHEELIRIHGAAIEAELAESRDALLEGIAAPFVASLPTSAKPAEQLYLDLGALNRAGNLVDGTIPLEIWLRNAIHFAAGRAQTAIFEQGLETARRSATLVLAHVSNALPRNIDELHKERQTLQQEWQSEVERAVPIITAHLEARIDNLEAKVAQVFADRQLGRLYINFTYEAAREALDERRRMLAHGAAGLLNPDISIERKARVERTMRELDPDDVIALYGASLVPGGYSSGRPRAEFLLSGPSGDILASSGCVRLAVGGGGFGHGPWTDATITQLGHDMLMILHTYIRTCPLSFVVPGREPGDTDRSEQEARRLLNVIPGLLEFVSWTLRKESHVDRAYEPIDRAKGSAKLTFALHERAGCDRHLDALTNVCASTELALETRLQAYPSSDKGTYDLLIADLSGPHDLLRFIADDCEAFWTDGWIVNVPLGRSA
jgi:hypothetical protein